MSACSVAGERAGSWASPSPWPFLPASGGSHREREYSLPGC